MNSWQLSLYDAPNPVRLSELFEQGSDLDSCLYRGFIDPEEGNHLFHTFLHSIAWQAETIKLYGKTYPVPRLTAWHGEKGKDYTYSNILHKPNPWNHPLLEIKARVERFAETEFNSALLNLYRDGSDSMAWHSDDEPELGSKPVIASLSLGASRRFELRRKRDHAKCRIELNHGDLLVMSGPSQTLWKHQVPKDKKCSQPRINITFRTIYPLVDYEPDCLGGLQ